jgi:hypothetical protein
MHDDANSFALGLFGAPPMAALLHFLHFCAMQDTTSSMLGLVGVPLVAALPRLCAMPHANSSIKGFVIEPHVTASLHPPPPLARLVQPPWPYRLTLVPGGRVHTQLSSLFDQGDRL